jgi:glutathione S-transferase
MGRLSWSLIVHDSDGHDALMIRIWGRRNSLNVQKVMWLLGELRIEHEHVPAGGPFGMLSEPQFGALNPNRLVPVLQDENGSIWESHAILRYLAARHGNVGWWPEDPFERSLADRWMDWCQSAWQPAFIGGVFWGYWRTPEPERDLVAIERAVDECARLISLLDEALAGRPFLTGQQLSLADIPAGASMYRYFALPIRRPSVPHVEAWHARLRERAPYRTHVEIPFDDLKARLAF